MTVASYVEKSVVFIDILGFRTRLKNQSLDELLKTVQIFQSYLDFSNEAEYSAEITAISDSIIIAANISSIQSLKAFLSHLNFSIAALSISGIWVRGAIHYGDHYSAEKVVISPALTVAYELESKIAKNPRVIISPAFQRLFLLYSERAFPDDFENFWNQYSYQDQDGFRFLDYCKSFYSKQFNYTYSEDVFHPDSSRARFSDHLDDDRRLHFFIHRENLEREFIRNNENPEIKSKFYWLAHQHQRNLAQAKKSCESLSKTDKNFEDTFLAFNEFSLSMGTRHNRQKNP